jgi:succinate dehydrogenase/fumarate reductase flavoprotein subunit
VAGSGAAAFSAAVSAASTGCNVLMLEKAAQVGGTTRRSGGATWIPNNHLMRARHIADPRDMALKYMAKLAHPTRYEPDHPTLGLTPNDHSLLAAFYERGAEAIEALEAAGALGTVHDGDQPDYSADLPENHSPTGRYFHPAAFLNPAAHHGNGADLIAQLHAGAERLGVEVLVDHEVLDCIQSESGDVIGALAANARGAMRIGARKGVIFGTGGFLQNAQMCDDFLRGPVFGGCAVPTNTGDFVHIGMRLGADLGNMSQAWWSEVVLEQALENRSTSDTIWMPGGDSMILVNRYGRRVVNEKMPYNERSQAHFYWDAGAREYPNLLLFCLFDDAMALNPAVYRNPAMRAPIPMPGENPPWVITGADWKELSAGIRDRLAEVAQHTGGFRLADGFVAGLKETVERYNSFAASGRDLDFHRGETPIQLFWGGTSRPGNEMNSTMFPFQGHGPYHAVILGGGALDTKGGPRTDCNARVLDFAGNPIPGLFGAGNCVAAPAGQAYWAAGGTIGPALVFGYLAGQAAAGEPTRKWANS